MGLKPGWLKRQFEEVEKEVQEWPNWLRRAAGLPERKIMRRLDFKSPEFHAGLNYTVRLGTKWADLNIGETVAIAETDGEVLGTGEIIIIIRSKLVDVPDDVLKYEHASDAQDYIGLCEAMERAYGEDKISEDSIVTSIGFLFHDRTISE